MKPIQLFKPKFEPEEVLGDIAEIMKSGWVGLGPKTEEFENKFAAYVGARHAVAVNSCTAALHLALKALNITEGMKVATTPMTFISTNAVILYEKANPVFIDVDKFTMNMSYDDLREQCGRTTIRAIMVVHYAGQPIDMEPFYALANEFNIPIIEDAAHAAGARYKNGKAVGSNPYHFGLTCFSFHAVKNLPMGDGGMITTNLSTVAERLRRLRWLGIDKSTFVRTKAGESNGYNWMYNVKELGFKYHPNDITSIIGINQLEHLPAHNLHRRQIRRWYEKYITSNRVKFVGLEEPDGSVSSCHIVAIKVPRSSRDGLIERLNREDIFPGVHYYPNHLYPIFEDYTRHMEVVEYEWERLISLPCHLELTKQDVQRISQAIMDFFGR